MKVIEFNLFSPFSVSGAEVNQPIPKKHRQLTDTQLLVAFAEDSGQSYVLHETSVPQMAAVLEARPFTYLLLGYDKAPVVLDGEAAGERMLNSQEGNLYVPQQWTPSNCSWYRRKAKEAARIGAEGQLRAQSAFIVQELLLHLAYEYSASLRGKSGAGSHSAHLVRKIVDYIDRHGAEPLTLGRLAAHFGLHPIYLGRIFKRYVGMSPIHYHLTLKMERAKERLIRSNDSVKMIASELGMSNPYYFSRYFKSYTGLAPTEYRAVSSALSLSGQSSGH